MAEIDFNLKGNDLDSNIETVNLAFDYLKSFKDISKLIEDEKASKAFQLTHLLSSYYMNFNKVLVGIIEEKNIIQLHYNLNEHYSVICGNLKNTKDEGFSETDSRKKEILSNSLNQLNFITIYSVSLRLKYFEMGGTNALVKLLENQDFTNKFKYDEFYDRIVANINWLSQNADLYKSEWNELNAAEVLLKISRNIPTCKCVAYMTFANIATDRQIDTLPEINEIVSELIKYVDRAAVMMKESVLLREQQPFIEESENTNKTSMYDVYLIPVTEYNQRFTLTGVLMAL